MSSAIHPVILCGGSGTRLWPLSRKSYPKQFSSLTGKESLFQASVQRVSGPGFAAPIVVTGSDFRFIVTEQMSQVGIDAGEILIEPAARNTAPAILAAALSLQAREADAMMLVAPSDHVIPDSARIPAARDGQLVTFGVRPDRAETGYGWLELSQLPDAAFSPEPQRLVRFIEKPDSEAAQIMFDGGRHLWNAGIFLSAADAGPGARGG